MKKIIGIAAAFLAINSYADAPSCGYYKQTPCVNNTCYSGLSVSNGICVLTGMSQWIKYPLATDRSYESHPGFVPNHCGNGPSEMNCWKWDDSVRDNLDMVTADLAYSSPPWASGAAKKPSLGFFAGRYGISQHTPTTLCQSRLQPIN